MLGFSIMVGGVFLSLGCWLAINIKDIVLFFFLFATLFYYNVIGFIFHSLVIYVQACFFFCTLFLALFWIEVQSLLGFVDARDFEGLFHP